MVEAKLKSLEENLLKKDTLLDKLHLLCDKQLDLLEDSNMEAEDFDNCMEEQDGLLQELTGLNEEADELYECLHTEVFSADGPYVVQIEVLRNMISKVMDKFDSLQTKEQTKKEKLDSYFERERKAFGTGRKSSKAALDYYKSMSRSGVVPPQFMDQKK